MEHSFKFENGQIYLVTNLKVWGENITEEINVTDKLIPVINQYFSHKTANVMKDYKIEDGKFIYVGKDKDRYQK